jgi:hypothetical protein
VDFADRQVDAACQPKPRAQRAVGGEGGIRTHVPVTRQDAFEAPPLRPLRYLSVRRMRARSTFYYSPPSPPHDGPANLRKKTTRSRTAFTEEPLHQRTALLFPYAGGDREPVVEPWQLGPPDR